MGWIEEKREYKEHFLNTELDLGYENIVKDYLTFMSKNFGYSVAANLSCPETDGKCCPQIAGHGVKKNRLCFN